MSWATVALTCALAACAPGSATGQSPTTSATPDVTATVSPPTVPPTVPAATTTSAATPTPPTAGAPTLSRLTVDRTGGIAGFVQQVEIAPDGSWVFTDERRGKVEQGQLTATQRNQLARLTSDPALALEARRTPPPGACADAFLYTVVVGELSFRYEQCGGTSQRPLADEMLNLVVDATPL